MPRRRPARGHPYDSAGNLTAADWPATGVTRAALGSRTYAGSQLATAGRIRYEYDAAGRTTLRQVTRLSKKPDTWHYTWDAEDHLTDVITPDGTRWRYRYDPFGRRTVKLRLAADGTTIEERIAFTWDGPTLAEQTTQAAYLPGLHTLTWDHRGPHPLAQSETMRTTEDGGQEQTNRRFFAIVTDLVGTPVELVDPETARYTTPDPLGLDPAPNPDTYVHNPHTSMDPYGLSPHPKITPGKNFKPHYLKHRALLEEKLGKKYGKWKDDEGAGFAKDLDEMISCGRLKDEGLGTLKKDQEPARIFRGEGLTLALKEDGEFWTLLESGTGMGTGIQMLGEGE